MEKSVVLGIDIGGTNTIYGFIMRDGTIIFHDEIPTYPNSDLTHLPPTEEESKLSIPRMIERGILRQRSYLGPLGEGGEG